MTNTFILFELLNTTYGIPSDQVKQMEMIDKITPVPNAPPYVEGVVFCRGQVIPAINLRTKFGFPKIPYDIRTRLIVIQNQQRTVGLIADTAREFVVIPPEQIQPPPEGITSFGHHYLSGVVTWKDRMVLILSVQELTANEIPEISPNS